MAFESNEALDPLIDSLAKFHRLMGLATELKDLGGGALTSVNVGISSVMECDSGTCLTLQPRDSEAQGVAVRMGPESGFWPDGPEVHFSSVEPLRIVKVFGRVTDVERSIELHTAPDEGGNFLGVVIKDIKRMGGYMLVPTLLEEVSLSANVVSEQFESTPQDEAQTGIVIDLATARRAQIS